MSDGARISLVAHTLNPGGAERLIVDMALYFARSSRVDVVCIDEVGAWAHRLRREGVAVTSLNRQPGFDLSVVLDLARHFRRCRTDLIHAHQSTPWFYAALSRLFYRTPVLLFEEHGRFYPEVFSRRRVLVNRLLIRRLTKTTVAVSEDIRARLKTFEGLDNDEISVIHNGSHPVMRLPAERKNSLRANLGIGIDDFVVGSVGRLDPIKNFPMLLEAVRLARRTSRSIRCLLVGDGPEAAGLQEYIRDHGLEQDVILSGYRADARDLVQCMNMFVLSSWSEGISMALLEAMASGICVAVSDIGGNRDIVRDGIDGWLVEPGDSRTLSDVIVRAAGDPDMTTRFDAAALRRFESAFSFDHMCAQYEQLYKELVPALGS